jgi:hypothetical protein
MRDSSGEQWFTLTQAAVAVRRSRRSVRRWVDTGMPAQRVRGVIYIQETDLFARLRLILMTEPEVKTRHERPALSAVRMPPRNGTHLRVIDHDGNIVREGEAYDWSEMEAVPGGLPYNMVPRRATYRVWFVTDTGPSQFAPHEYREIIVTRRVADEKSDVTPMQ